jgi:hypothetical protein
VYVCTCRYSCVRGGRVQTEGREGARERKMVRFGLVWLANQ